MDSLVNVNFEPLADVVNNLINKISSAVGWIATHDTPNRHAVNTFIEEIEKSNRDPWKKAFLISNAKKSIKEYMNQAAITQIALQELSPSAQPEKMEDDWVAQFMDKARLVSDKDFQLIWGNVLAREANEPNAIPRALLNTLGIMDRQDAENFTALCRTAVMFENVPYPIIIASNLEEYRPWGISLETLTNCESLGLIQSNLVSRGASFGAIPFRIPAQICYHDKHREILVKQQILIGDVMLTKTGKALCAVIETEEIDGFWENICVPYWEQNRMAEDADSI